MRTPLAQCQRLAALVFRSEGQARGLICCFSNGNKALSCLNAYSIQSTGFTLQRSAKKPGLTDCSIRADRAAWSPVVSKPSLNGISWLEGATEAMRQLLACV